MLYNRDTKAIDRIVLFGVAGIKELNGTSLHIQIRFWIKQKRTIFLPLFRSSQSIICEISWKNRIFPFRFYSTKYFWCFLYEFFQCVCACARFSFHSFILLLCFVYFFFFIFLPWMNSLIDIILNVFLDHSKSHKIHSKDTYKIHHISRHVCLVDKEVKREK